MKIEILIPCYNEKDSICLLLSKLDNVLGKEYDYLITIIDDGSNDGTNNAIKKYIDENSDSKIRLLEFRNNMGKSAALDLGFKIADADVVITMDADLQDEPEEIPFLIDKLNQGYDLVSGWKKNRNDPLEKRIPSLIFNKITSYIGGLKLHDYNCGFKAYKIDVVKEIELYGELHRYIPLISNWKGFKVTEIPVKHNARKFGKSKYGLERYARGFFDLITVTFLNKYEMRPLHLFGGLGLFLFIIGFLIETYFTLLWILGKGIGDRPLFFLGILLIIVGSQTLFFGLIGDILAKNKIRKHIYSKYGKID